MQGEQAVRRVLELLANPSTNGAVNEALLLRAGSGRQFGAGGGSGHALRVAHRSVT
jgi:hypothetical protein